MKFELTIDATPAEARAFLGLPDLSPLHDAWLQRMQDLAANGPAADDWQKLVQAWAAGVPGMASGLKSWQDLLKKAVQTPPDKD